MARPTGVTTIPYRIRITAAVRERIKIAAAKLGVSKATAASMAVGIGLERMRRINYQIPEAVNDASEKTDEPAIIALKAAEKPPGAKSDSAAIQDDQTPGQEYGPKK